MQLDTVHRMYQLKAEIREYTTQKVNETDRAQKFTGKFQTLAVEGCQLADKERFLTKP